MHEPPPFPIAEYEQRLARVRATMQRRDLDLLVVTDPADIEWLSAFQAARAMPCLLFVHATQPPQFLVAEGDHFTLAQTSVYRDVIMYQAGAPIGTELISALHARAVVVDFIGLQFCAKVRAITDPQRIALVRAFPSARWADTTLTIVWLRAIKSAAELHCLETAMGWAEGALETASLACVRGASESNILSRMVERMLGSSKVSGRWPMIPPRVIVGTPSQGTAATSAARVITGEYDEDEPWQLVLLECAASCNGYHAIAARTVLIGTTLPENIKLMERSVNRALNAQLDAMKPGALAKTIYAAAATVFNSTPIEGWCLGKVGYSVGLCTAPDAADSVLELTASCEFPLAAGMVLFLAPWLQTTWGVIALSAMAVVGPRKGRVLGRPTASISRPDITEVALRR